MTRSTAGLLVGLAVATSAAVTFAFLYFSRLSRAELGVVRVETGEDPLAPNKPGTLRVFVGEGPFLQKDTVSPRSQHTGTVYYPIPFAAPPNLKLVCRPREFVVLKQTELGFVWSARPVPEDFKNGRPENDDLLDEPIEKLKSVLKPNVQFDDFTWEARGIPASAATLRAQLYEQTGTFPSAPGQEGEVTFPIAYAGPPNIELDGPTWQNRMSVVVVEAKPTGFRWRNTGKSDTFEGGPVKWRSRGIPTLDPLLSPKK
jgi:hypothetical protein